MSKYQKASSEAHAIERVNRGDLAVFGQTDELPNRKDIVNSTQANDRTVFPGDVIDIKSPSSNYQFFWHLTSRDEFDMTASQEYDMLTDFLGYREVIERKDENGEVIEGFKVRRWKRDAAYRVRSGSYILMYRDEDTWKEQVKKRDGIVDSRIDQVNQAVHAEAERNGFQTFETRRGNTEIKVRGGNRH
jgi:hypothetical protein